MPQTQPPLITGLLLADGSVARGDLMQQLMMQQLLTTAAPAAAPASSAADPPPPGARPRMSPPPGGQGQSPGSTTGNQARAGAPASSMGRGLRGENMRQKHCSGQLKEMDVWPDKRKRARGPRDRSACAKDASTYGVLGEAVQYATTEHGITEDAAEARLDSLRASLGLTVHQTTQVLKVVRSLRWQVHCFIPEHPAGPSEESKCYPPTQLPKGEATPVPGAEKVTALQAVRAVKAQGLCPDIPDECWFNSRLPSMRPECWQQRRKRSRAAAG
jgi:hypothetical protein